MKLQDGKVIEDSGPIVSTNTTEDTDKQETETTEVGTRCGSGDSGGLMSFLCRNATSTCPTTSTETPS